MVSPTSTPQPRANGDPASSASRDRQRIPDSGWVGVQPVRLSIPLRANRTTNPCPPPGVDCGGRIAMVISASPAATGPISTAVLAALSSRSASMNKS